MRVHASSDASFFIGSRRIDSFVKCCLLFVGDEMRFFMPHGNTVPTQTSAMTIEESRRSQRPYRYGMVLLCVGALINWLGLAENYVEPVRYVGVACIVAGALLICAAMCCWLHAPPTRTSSHTHRSANPITAQIDDPIHVISIDDPMSGARQKPPDYEAVADAPPSYDDAIKLNPGQLARSSRGTATSLEHTIPGAVVVIPTSGVMIAEPHTPSPPPPYAR